MTNSNKTSKTRQKFDFGMEPKTTTLLPTWYASRSLLCIRVVAVALLSAEDVIWRRGPSVIYFCPALDTSLGRSGRKSTTLVRDLEYFMHTKFHQNPSSGSGEDVENVNCLTDGRQTDDGRTTHDHNRSLQSLAPVP